MQRVAGGAVERELRKRLEPMMAALFDNEDNPLLRYPQYFDAVNDIKVMKTLKVFIPRLAWQMPLFLRNTDSINNIQESITSLTGIPREKQLLLFGHTELKDIVEQHETIQAYPKSVQSAQFFLFEKDQYHSKEMLLPCIPPFPSCLFGFSKQICANDIWKCVEIAKFINWRTKDAIQSQNLLFEANNLHLRLYIQNMLPLTERKASEIDKIVCNTERRKECILVAQENINLKKHLDILKKGTAYQKDKESFPESFCHGNSDVTEMMTETKKQCELIKEYLGVLGPKFREASTSSSTEHLGCIEDHCLSKVEDIRQKIEMQADLNKDTLSKQDLEELCISLLSHYNGHCVHNLNIVHNVVNKQISNLLKYLTRTEKVEFNIKRVMERQTRINEKLHSVEEQMRILPDWCKPFDICKGPRNISALAGLDERIAEKEPDEHKKNILAEINQQGLMLEQYDKRPVQCSEESVEYRVHFIPKYFKKQ